ncbi:MAG TPA: phage tail sheath subtilisin-like domain-containing protein [Steroidobacteraceae bacterium]|nr:phage tail sheath subtilisin-like domain-containing protein [Steroidobacteraceae bacterium]
MPAALTYPGVYIEEIPSGVRTIVGVATSITAFFGRAPLGPVNEPTTINSYGDFERAFGGLNVDYPLSYAVRDFYLNGGSQALVVRLYRKPAAAVAPAVTPEDTATVKVDGLTLAAASPGEWGKSIRVALDPEVSSEVPDALFNLTVTYGNRSERFINLTTADKARRIDRVLGGESNLVRWKGVWAAPAAMPKLDATVAKLAALKTAKAGTDADAIKTAQLDYDNALAAARDEAWAAEPAVAAAEKKLADAKAANPVVPATVAAAEAELTAAKKSVTDALVAMGGDKGQPLDDLTYLGIQAEKTGLFALDKADLFNLLCLPADKREGNTSAPVYQAAMAYCAARRAMLVVDPPAEWSAIKETAAAKARDGLATLGLSGNAARNAALYFPRLRESDPLRDSQIDTFVPCGAVAGIMARTDVARGVWKAPAGLDAAVNGIQGFDVNLNDAENGMLNPLGINCLRAFPINGRVVWGARTLRGADQLADEYKYVPVRRTALYIEESLYRGTQWVVFEPNDEPLWAQIRLNVGAFMHSLFRQGAFQGTTPRDAYFVKCDKETTTQDDINKGIVNILVGFAPLKPAEFVVIKLQQIAGQIQA